MTEPPKITVTRPLEGCGFHAKEADYLWIKVEGGTAAQRDEVARAAEVAVKDADPPRKTPARKTRAR